MISPVLAESPALLAHHPLGVSTGYMDNLRGDWTAQIEQAWSFSPFAVELSALSEDEIDGLELYLQSAPALPFRYLSVHGPSKGRSMSESALVRSLKRLARNAEAIVMHPDTIEDPAPYRALGRKLVLENMDARKEDGRSADELERWFDELPAAGFCFDLAHAWSLDESMLAATELLDAFRTRLRHLHVSSLSTDCHHVALTEEHEELFGPLLGRCLDVPWILEAPPREP
jgi:sugar phosphate isomerase/epimerase